MAIKKTHRGKYEVDFRDADGRRHQKTFKRKDDAERAYNQARRDVWEGTFISPRKARSFAEVAPEWLANKASLRPNTIAEWERHVSKLMPYLGTVPVALAVPKAIMLVADSGHRDRSIRGIVISGSG